MSCWGASGFQTFWLPGFAGSGIADDGTRCSKLCREPSWRSLPPMRATTQVTARADALQVIGGAGLPRDRWREPASAAD